MALSRPSAVPHPIHERALEDLRYIRSAVESAGSFTVSGSGGIEMGVVGLVAAVVAAPETGTPSRWLTIWLAAAVVATLTGIAAMIRKSRRTGSSLVSPPARRFALAFAPSIVAGAALTAALAARGEHSLLPPLWLLLYGIAVSAGGALHEIIRWTPAANRIQANEQRPEGSESLSPPHGGADRSDAPLAFFLTGDSIMQSTFHVAIIMDGNGRWATERGLTRPAGHRAGATAVRSVVESAPSAGIDLLTLYAFSSDNWKRPPAEVGALMRLFERFLEAETARCADAGVRVNVIGRRDRLSPSLVRLIDSSERATASGRRLRLRLAIDYSSRDAITRATCQRCGDHSFRQRLAWVTHADSAIEDVDLLIRTGRQQRLSDFLLFEAAYAELQFSERLWPDFRGSDLLAAVEEYRKRDRRFGAIETVAAKERVACTT